MSLPRFYFEKLYKKADYKTVHELSVLLSNN